MVSTIATRNTKPETSSFVLVRQQQYVLLWRVDPLFDLPLKEEITPLRIQGLTLRLARRPVLGDWYAFKFPKVVPTYDVSCISTCQSVLCLAQGWAI